MTVDNHAERLREIAPLLYGNLYGNCEKIVLKAADALEAKDAEIERLKVAEGGAMLVVEQQDLDLKRSMAVAKAARKVLQREKTGTFFYDLHGSLRKTLAALHGKGGK